MAKRVIRLTESDLIRLVKKVIRESDDWTDEDENELSSVDTTYKGIKDRMMSKSKDIQSRYPERGDDFYDEINTMYDEPDYKEFSKKRDDLLGKKYKHQERLRYDDERLRYDDVVKNRPSDFDVDSYSSEYDDLNQEIGGMKKDYPYLKDEPDFDTFADKYSKVSSRIKPKEDRRNYLSKHLDKDYRKKR